MTYALSLPMERRPQTTSLHPALSCAVTFIFLQLYLKPAVRISSSKSLSMCSLDFLYLCDLVVAAVVSVVLVWLVCVAQWCSG